MLIELADYYKINLRELLNGEKEEEAVDEVLDETVKKVVEYCSEDKQKITKRMHLLFLGGIFAAVIHLILSLIEKDNNFLGGLCLGIMHGMLVVGAIMTSQYAMKIKMMKGNFVRKLK